MKTSRGEWQQMGSFPLWPPTDHNHQRSSRNKWDSVAGQQPLNTTTMLTPCGKRQPTSSPPPLLCRPGPSTAPCMEAASPPTKPTRPFQALLLQETVWPTGQDLGEMAWRDHSRNGARWKEQWAWHGQHSGCTGTITLSNHSNWESACMGSALCHPKTS